MTRKTITIGTSKQRKPATRQIHKQDSETLEALHNQQDLNILSGLDTMELVENFNSRKDYY